MNVKQGVFPEYWTDVPLEIDSSFLTCININSSSGGEIICYQAGDKNSEPLIIVPPLHMPVAALIKIIERFSKNYFVISFEVRGGAFLGLDQRKDLFRIESMASDFADVCRAFQSPVYVFGWCNSAKVIARAVSLKLVIITRLVLLAPSGITGSPSQYTPSIFGETDQLTDAEIKRARELFKASMISTEKLSKEDELIGTIFGLNFNSGEKFRAFVSAKLYRNTSQNYDVKDDIRHLFDRVNVLLVLPDEDCLVISADVCEAVKYESNVTTYMLIKAGHAPVFSHCEEIVSISNKFYIIN